MVSQHPSAWLFEDWPEGTLARDMQVLNTTLTRLRAIALMNLRAILNLLESTK